MASTDFDRERISSADLVTRTLRDQCQRRLLLPLLRTLFPVTIAGQRHLLNLPTPCIFAADHGSHLDTLAILAILPEEVRARTRVAAAEDYWYRDPLRKLAVGALGGFPFPRKGRVGLNRAAALLDSGHAILIYPQGTRAGGAFRPGAAILALQTGLPIVPLAVQGGHECWPKGQLLPRRGPLRITIGAPLVLAPGLAPSAGARQIEEAVHALTQPRTAHDRDMAA